MNLGRLRVYYTIAHSSIPFSSRELGGGVLISLLGQYAVS